MQSRHMPDEDFVSRLKGHAPRSGVSPEEAREQFSSFHCQYQERDLPRMDKVNIRDDLSGFFIWDQQRSDRGILLFFHGGGFTVGSTRAITWDSWLLLAAPQEPPYSQSITASHPNTISLQLSLIRLPGTGSL